MKEKRVKLDILEKTCDNIIVILEALSQIDAVIAGVKVKKVWYEFDSLGTEMEQYTTEVFKD